MPHNSLRSDLPETERTAEWVASLPETDNSGSEINFPQSDSQIIPSNLTDSQDQVRAVGAMPSAREQLRSTSTLSISSAPPNVSEIVTQVRTWVDRLVRPVNRLIQNMTQRTTHNAVKDVSKSLLF